MSFRIIRREEWGAFAPRSRIVYASWPKSSPLIVHHAAGTTPAVSAELRQDSEIVRGIDRFHYYTRGWTAGGVGYSYLVTPSGRIFEGRGANSSGAHTIGFNTTHPAVCLVGDYSSRTPSSEAVHAVAWLANHIGHETVVAHRDLNATTCPGDAGYAALGSIRAAIRAGAQAPPTQLPHGGTLRLVIAGKSYAGWDEARGPLLWVARHGLDPAKPHAIAWRGNVWRGAKDVENVSRNLARRYLGF